MKQRIGFVVMVSVMALSILACQVGGLTSIRGSGNVVMEKETFTGFDKVDVSQAFKVDISQGDTFSVVIRIDDNNYRRISAVMY